MPHPDAVRPPAASPEPAVTRAAIAAATGVTEQAVSNWIRRHRDTFPAPVGRDRYPTAAVAGWLDTRRIPYHLRWSNEPERATYGQRFRKTVGLLPGPTGGAAPARAGHGTLRERLWAPLDKHRRDTDPTTFQNVVMSLLCVMEYDPPGWAAVVRAGREDVHEVVDRVRAALPTPLRHATDVFDALPVTGWWRHRLTQIVSLLAAQVRGSADNRRPYGGDRVTAAVAFDYLLDAFAEARHHSPDQFLTPAELAHLMTRIADPLPSDQVHDPCCGSGELLVAADVYAAGSARLTGRAVAARAWRLAVMNLAVHGGQATLGDAPPEDPQEIGAGPGRYDVVLANPPFNMADWRLAHSPWGEHWPYGTPPPHNANFGWLQLCAETLNERGRAVVLMPSSATGTQNPREQRIRRALVDAHLVRGVIALPEHLFRETTTATTLWILGRPDRESEEEILLMDARQATRAVTATHRVLTDNGCGTLLATYRRWRAGEQAVALSEHGVAATTATIARIREHDYQLAPAHHLPGRARGPAGHRPTATLPELREQLWQLQAEAAVADRELSARLNGLRPWKH